MPGEEANQRVPPVDLLTDEEGTLPYAVGLDLTIAFLAAAARLTGCWGRQCGRRSPRSAPACPILTTSAPRVQPGDLQLLAGRPLHIEVDQRPPNFLQHAQCLFGVTLTPGERM